MRDIEEDLRTIIGRPFQSRFSFVSAPEETWHPLTDVYETGAEIIVKMELPGLEAKDIQITLEGNKLVVQGTRRDHSTAEKVSYHGMEISYGPFRRVILLPLSARIGNPRASYRNGFLEVRMPFCEQPSTDSMIINIE